MSNAIGLDKLTFFLSSGEFKVAPDFEAQVEMPVNAATGEAIAKQPIYQDTNGRTVCGRVAHFNTSDYQVTLKADRDGRGSFCVVQFSAGAFSETNLEPLGRDAIVDKTCAVERDLASKGLEAHLRAARLSRVDVVRNVQMNEPVDCYAPAMAALGAKRRTRKMDFGGTGFILGNKTWEVSMYDKAEEMKHKGYENASCPANTLRPELRFLKYRGCGVELGNNVEELRHSWDELSNVYRQRMKRDIFRAKIEAKRDLPLEWEAAFAYSVQNGGRRRWDHFKSHAVLGLLRYYLGEPMALKMICQGLEFDPTTESGKRQIRRVADELKQATFAGLMQSESDGHQVKYLYDELKRRVLE